MLYLFLGPNDFEKQQQVAVLEQKLGIKPEIFSDAENMPMAEDLAGQDLFSKQKIYVLRNMAAKFADEAIVNSLAGGKNHIIFLEEKLDKRNADNKKMLANPKVEVRQFALPHGEELNNWLKQRAQDYKLSMDNEALEALAVRLGRDAAKETKVGGKIIDVQEVYNLWQADSELKKLAAFANGSVLQAKDVNNLVSENGEVDVFELTNAIADNDKQKSLQLMHGFLRQQATADEKTAIIQLNALLAEQFRNVAMIQDLTEQKKTEGDILEMTGWKSGRLFVMKKIASRFANKKVLDFLNKLKALDEELKTSSTPPRVLLDLIVVQLF
ncbi:MAG: hypothetical protein HY918_00945 [Candidatus Doudnabacteria bacterium]|nr:hypothetical protein [Candidatus Doudnabacteria bacterium]